MIMEDKIYCSFFDSCSKGNYCNYALTIDIVCKLESFVQYQEHPNCYARKRSNRKKGYWDMYG